MTLWCFVGREFLQNLPVIVSTLTITYDYPSPSLSIPCLKQVHLSLYNTACFVLLNTIVAEVEDTNPYGLVRYSGRKGHRPQGLIWHGSRKNTRPFWSIRKVPKRQRKARQGGGSSWLRLGHIAYSREWNSRPESRMVYRAKFGSARTAECTEKLGFTLLLSQYRIDLSFYPDL